MSFNSQEETASRVTFCLSIGRNVPDNNGPMSAESWEQFKTQVDTILSSFGATLYAKAESKSGQYNGLEEATCLWLVTMSGHNARMLRPTLARLATRYGQEAIGFIEQTDTNTLIYATKETVNA